MPIGKEETFKGIVDLIQMKAYIYTDDLGTHSEVTDIPEDMQDAAQEYRNRLLESIAESDEELMMKYLDGEELTVEEIHQGIRKATISLEMVPVVCGSSYKNKGVQLLLDAVVEYMPSPLDVPAIKGKLPNSGEETERHSSDESLQCSGFQDHD